jgi:WD40-like Beta Propeller Repeat
MILIVLLSFAAGVLAQTTTSSSDQTLDVSKLQVLEKKTLPLRDILEVTSLSPDGTHLARVSSTQLCVSLVNRTDSTCVLFSKNQINADNGSFQWSPDGSKIIFSEDFLKLLVDSDVWLFDLATKQLRNLTPEPKGREPNCSLLGDKNPCHVDLLPQFSSDGQHIFFLQYEGLAAATQGLPVFNSISLLDNKTITRLRLEKKGTILLGFAVAPDDNLIVLSGGISVNDSWVEIKSFDQIIAKKVNFDFATLNAPARFVFSNDQKYILTSSPVANLSSPLRIINLETDKITKVDNNQTAVAAGWQPGGSAMLYSTRNIKDPSKNGLFVIPAPGQSPRKLISGTFTASDEFAWGSAQRISWADNNTVLFKEIVKGQPEKLVLLKLGQK